MPGVIVTSGGTLVLSTVRTAAFQVPKTALGGMPVLPSHSGDGNKGPICQSQALLSSFGWVMSVMNSAGHIGRPSGSVPAKSPVRAWQPTSGWSAEPGSDGSGETESGHGVGGEVPVELFMITELTPSVRACSSLYQTLIVSPLEAVFGLKAAKHSFSLKTVFVLWRQAPPGQPVVEP